MPEDAAGSGEQIDVKIARDKYVREQTREHLFTVKEDRVPRGVAFSQVMMALPLLGCTGMLCMLAPMAGNPAIVDPTNFNYLARTTLRLLTLNVGFNAGIHYGMGAAMYEVALDEEERSRIKRQMLYSAIPAIAQMVLQEGLLLSASLSPMSVVFFFNGMLLVQVAMLQGDRICAEKEMVPWWFLKNRTLLFSLYMSVTVFLFGVYYTRCELLQRTRPSQRIENIKAALEMDDIDFLHTVNEQMLDYDEADLREGEKELRSRMQASKYS